MRILHVIASFNPIRGGVVNVCSNLSNSLAKMGHDVTIVCSDYNFIERSNNISPFVKVLPQECMFSKFKFYYTPNIKKFLANNIKNFDVIHMHEYRTYQNIIVHKYAKQFDIPYVLQAHGSLPYNSNKIRLKLLYDVMCGHVILKDAANLIALTKTEEMQYVDNKIPPDKIKIVPNGIDLNRFSNLPSYGSFRSKHFIRDRDKLILYVGRLHESKGVNLLIESFNLILRTSGSDNYRLILIGPNDGYKPHLVKLINKLGLKDKVLLLGFIPFSEKFQAYVDSDVFVTPRYSGFPVTFLEACACGIPVITTNEGDQLDWIKKIGLITSYDKNELAQSILKIVNSKYLRDDIRNNEREIIINEFNWDIIAKKVEEIYRCSCCVG